MNLARSPKRRSVRTLTAAAATLVLTSGALLTGAAAAQADTPVPPWVATESTEHESAGTLSFYNSSGNRITTGALNTPLAAYAVASAGLPPTWSAASGITVYIAAPQAGEPANFSEDTISASTAVPYAGSMPSSVAAMQTSGHLVAPIVLGYNDFAADGYTSSVAGWTTTYEVRIQGSDLSVWYSADIQVDTGANTWTQVYPAPAVATTTTVSGPTTGTVGTPVTYTAAVTATSGTPTGTVQFKVDGVNLGSPVTVAAAASPGVQYTPLDNTAHVITAAYTPTDSAAFTPSSDTTGVTLTATGTPVTVPDAPTIGTATAGNATATVHWTAPANNGGSTITGYHVQISKNGGAYADAVSPVSVTVSGTTATVNGLSNGSSYAFKVAAQNVQGLGAYSGASNTVTPVADTTSLTISGSTTVKYGSSTTTSTTLKDTVTAHVIAGAAVRLLSRTSPTAPWHVEVTLTTNSSGAASRVVTPGGRTYYEWQFLGSSSFAASTSSTQTVAVSQTVALGAKKVGSVMKLYGWVGPAPSGQTVYLQRASGTKWVGVTSTKTKNQRLPNGQTRVGFVFNALHGTITYRVYAPATSAQLLGYSSNLRVSA